MDTITKQPRVRHRLGRLAALATVSVALLAFGFSGVANANTVYTATGQAFTARPSASGDGRSFNVRGVGFASNAKIRIDLRYAATGTLVLGAAQLTATASGTFSKSIPVSRSQLSGSCLRFEYMRSCHWSGIVYARALQYSSPRLLTPWAETVVAGSCFGTLYSCHL
jgi:hypothetical protein